MAEPEWDQASRDLALALDQVALCTVCGGPAELCQDPAREFDWQVPEPIRCHRTTRVRERQALMTEQSNPHQDALVWRVALRPDGS